jgi:hypothetical protein
MKDGVACLCMSDACFQVARHRKAPAKFRSEGRTRNDRARSSALFTDGPPIAIETSAQSFR